MRAHSARIFLIWLKNLTRGLDLTAQQHEGTTVALEAADVPPSKSTKAAATALAITPTSQTIIGWAI
jgi:hypothetical protein